jgi:hypothetical protein
MADSCSGRRARPCVVRKTRSVPALAWRAVACSLLRAPSTSRRPLLRPLASTAR